MVKMLSVFTICLIVIFGANVGLFAAVPSTLPTVEVREQLCLNGTWDFNPDGFGATTMQVPSTWDPHVDVAAWSHIMNFTYPAGWTGGVYSKSVTLPGSMSGKSIELQIGQARYVSETFINGTSVGTHNDGWTSFWYDITDELDGNELIEIDIDPAYTNPRGLKDTGMYGNNRGLAQDVFINAYPLLHVEREFFVKTTYTDMTIEIDIPVVNDDSSSKTFYIRNFIVDADDQVVFTLDVPDNGGWQTLNAGQSATYTCSQVWNDPNMWWPHDPYLYHVHTVLYDTDEITVLDWKKTRFGFNQMYMLNSKEFWFNGERLYTRGDGHHYFGCYQQTREYFEALFTSLKSWGCNLYRSHTNIEDPIMLTVADEMGMLVCYENGIYGSDGDDAGYYPDHVNDWVLRDRNHPSIVEWSVSNEVRWQGGDPIPHINIAKALDDTRIVFAEENGWCSDDICSRHYFDSTHCGPDPAAPGVIDGNKMNVMGEYAHGGYAFRTCFADTPDDDGIPQHGWGACGYECKEQDYGTGFWLHGECVRDKTKLLQADRRWGGYVLWAFRHYYTRPVPFNNNTTLYPSWPDLTLPGAKPYKIEPHNHQINWADPELPTTVPLPHLHNFQCYFEAVRCTDLMSDSIQKNNNFYEGDTFSRSFDLWYEDLREADHMKCEIIRKSDNAVLYSNDLTGTWSNIQPGTKYNGQNVSWVAPAVVEHTSVTINRTFYKGTEPGYTCSFDGYIHPDYDTGDLSAITNKNVAVYDPNGATRGILDNMGLSYTQESSLSDIDGAYDVLVIGFNNMPFTGTLAASFVEGGGRVLCLQQSSSPTLPVTLPSIVDGTQDDVQFLLQGKRHRVFRGIDQNGLSYWKNNVNTANDVYNRPSSIENIRVLCAADNDGNYAPILEVPKGNGTYILSQMEITDQYYNEPVAGRLLVNMLNYVGGYAPVSKAKTGLIANSGTIKTYYDSVNLRYTQLDSGSLPDLSTYSLLIVDGKDTGIDDDLNSEPNKTDLNDFVDNGGKIMICQMDNNTSVTYNQLISQYTLTRSVPSEQQRSIKCAVSWRLKDTTDDPVRYGYLNIPPPFEPNPDELLIGMNNIDFDWSVDMVDYSIKSDGSYPDMVELVAPRRIDWPYLEDLPGKMEVPAARAKYQNDWFVDREPILLKLKQGNGFWLVNQIKLEADGVRGDRIGNLLLTSLGASVGSVDTYYNVDYATGDTEYSNPDKVLVSADPAIIFADSQSTALITATIADNASITVLTATNQVQFSTDEGSFIGSSNVDAIDGVATIILQAGGVAGTATVGATATDLTEDSTEVNILPVQYADSIGIAAAPTVLISDGSSTALITAQIKDQYGSLFTQATNQVDFSLGGTGSLLGNTQVTAAAGTATVILQSAASEGTGTVTATSANIGSNTVEVEYVDTNWPYRRRLTITNNSGGALTNYQVRIDLTNICPKNNNQTNCKN